MLHRLIPFVAALFAIMDCLSAQDVKPLLARRLGPASIVLAPGKIDEQELKKAIPKIYDDAESSTWHVPLAIAKVSPSFLTSSYFYSRKTRPIHKSYPFYHPNHEPEGYIEDLRETAPVVSLT